MATYTGVTGHPFVGTGIGTYNFTLATTGPHIAQILLSCVPTSGLSVVVKQNGTTIFTSTALTATQNHFEVKVPINGMAADAISVVIASSTAIDQAPQTVKSIVTVSGGM